jgi:DNA polymerase I-like protein with 3'-5' exonuclease and polymerase domains
LARAPLLRHDELVVEAATAGTEAVLALVVERTSEAGRALLDAVPCTAGVVIAGSWAERP